MGALDTAVRQGNALYAGISNYGPEETTQAIEILREFGTPVLIHQPRYSMFDRRPEEGLLDVIGEAGVGAIAFSPLAQGLLTDRYLDGSVPAGSRPARAEFLRADQVNATYLERARALNEIAAGRGQTLAQLALRWVLRDERITSALIGASSAVHLEQNVAALSAAPLTAAEIVAIEPQAVHGTECAAGN